MFRGFSPLFLSFSSAFFCLFQQNPTGHVGRGRRLQRNGHGKTDGRLHLRFFQPHTPHRLGHRFVPGRSAAELHRICPQRRRTGRRGLSGHQKPGDARPCPVYALVLVQPEICLEHHPGATQQDLQLQGRPLTFCRSGSGLTKNVSSNAAHLRRHFLHYTSWPWDLAEAYIFVFHFPIR